MNRYEPHIQVIGNEDQGDLEMFTVTSKNRATGNETIVETNLTREKADALAVRCSLAESNPKVIYQVS
jgi:hypothetical protein